MSSPAAPFAAVVYAKDAATLAKFYERVLGLERVDEEEDSGFVLLAGPGIELSIVQSPKRIAESITIANPPKPRDETPIKLSFLVPDIEATRSTITETGGQLKPAQKAWSWRGCKHLDGIDPEGNVFQLREQCEGECA